VAEKLASRGDALQVNLGQGHMQESVPVKARLDIT
jgi:hypothetical protein